MNAHSPVAKADPSRREVLVVGAVVAAPALVARPHHQE